MPRIISIEEFMALDWPLADVRSPAEYSHGHIPLAVNIPLFSNDERAEIGTIYKKQGKETAVERGLSFAGANLTNFVSQAKHIAQEKKIKVHCWRGGMRSASMAWLFETAGLNVCVLEGGYKSYRQWVREILSIKRNIIILAGMTGTGKTAILHELATRGEQILDLENLASHRGSSFGNIGLAPQPTTEEFENKIAELWSRFNLTKPVWVEAESLKIGTCVIPPEINKQMKIALAIQIERPLEARLHILESEYGNFIPEMLVEATKRISKKLGGMTTNLVIEAINSGNMQEAIKLVLFYYDKTYAHAFQSRNIKTTLPVGTKSAGEAAELLINVWPQSFL